MVIKAMVADDQALIRESLKIILSAFLRHRSGSLQWKMGIMSCPAFHRRIRSDPDGYSDARHGWGLAKKK